MGSLIEEFRRREAAARAEAGRLCTRIAAVAVLPAYWSLCFRG